jgi:hypothetical protein
MAPRAWVEKFEAFPEYKRGTLYRCEAASAQKRTRPDRVTFELVHMDGAQCGRPVSVEFAKPIRVAGLAAQFFHACAIRPAANRAFQPRHCIGKHVLVGFDRDNDGHWHPVRFEPVVKELADDAAE